MADATGLDKKYLYRVSRNGVFLGVLQNVTSEFTIQQDINTAGCGLTIEVGDTSDRQFEAPEAILDESGNPITDEFGSPLLIERQPDIVGNLNSKALIRNNNTIAVYEVSSDYPNGLLVFSGWISRWKANFGASDSIIINCLSNGTELDNYLIQSIQTLDVSQASQNSTRFLQEDSKSGAWTRAGQKFTVGSGITNVAAILLKLAAASTGFPQIITVKIWASESDYFTGTPLGTATQTISSTTAADYTFTFPIAVTVNAGSTYFFSVTTSDAGANIYYQNTDLYAGGNMWVSDYAGGGGGGWIETPAGSVVTVSDLYFKTYYTSGATSVPFNSQDPTAMLRTIIDSYVNTGGTINYASGTTVLTNTTRSYTFKVNTVLEGIKKCLELSPFDWYWYVDPATNTIYFKETATAAEHTMIYGRHIQSLDVEASVEEVKNKVYFTGGDTGGNVYLYQQYSDATALSNNTGRVGLERLSDNRVTLSDTALALMTNFINAKKAENYQTTIAVNAAAYDISLFKLGQVVGFESFGSFVDNLLLQIVHIERHSDFVVLGLGVLPQRASAQVEDIQRSLDDVETIYNPTTPS